MQGDIDRVLISRQRIARRVRRLARDIVADHAADGRITIIPVLTGALVFCADLIRHMPLRMRIGLIMVGSYRGASRRPGRPALLAQDVGAVRGRHVLLLDDILDSGNTLKLVRPQIEALGPAGVRTCVLLRKDRPAARRVHVDYVGFDIPDVFVVGYGLDYDDHYRNLPDIVTLKKHLMP
jgi:hypoxanthine phosphoribosyltransferase